MERSGPTVPPPDRESLNTPRYRNIDSLKRRQEAELRSAGLHDRLAQGVTAFAGSFTFVYVHLVLFGFWIVANLGWISGIPKWDKQFVVLGMTASVEAIFLSTFVLISQ